MARMDLDTIIQDLNNRFAEPLPEFYKRRIIFWHDEDREFEDSLDEISLDNAKLLVLNGSNNFIAKKLLNVDDKTNNYLVYNPISYESQEDNWLLNIELYSEQFRADLISIWINEMDLPANPTFRKLVKFFKKFFGAQNRRKAFKKLSDGITTASQMHLAVMATICGCNDIKPNSIIKNVIIAGMDMETNQIYKNLVNYGADEAFWEMVKQGSGYFEGEDSTIEKLVTHILLTATSRTLRIDYLSDIDSFISIPHQAWCYEFVSEWIVGDRSDELFEILRIVEQEIVLSNRFKKIPLNDLKDTEIFPCINECILLKLMTDINNDVIDVDMITDMVEKRRTLAWFDEVRCYYEGIFKLAKMQKFFVDHSSGFHTVDPRKIWEEYREVYYKMDTYYREYHLEFLKSLSVGNENLDDLFKQVTEKVEGLYTHWFLGELGNNWSNACAEELNEYGHILEIPQQVDFYRQNVENEDNRVFVIISDALRYEVAASLAEQLRRETQSKVNLKSCEGIFPTVTKFGMAALLPHKELSITERNNGMLQILADGMSTDAGNREKVLKATNNKSVALKYKDILPMKRAERSELVKGMEVVYIYHDRIDEASHTSDRMVFSACDDAIEEIKNMVRIIRNEFGGTRVYITADHGFLYTYSPLSEESKVDKTTPNEKDVEIDRRYLITHKGENPEFLLPVKFMDDKYDVFAPRESVRIKKKGGGLNFVHGGISLQEKVVPVIEYYYLRNDSKTFIRNKGKYETKPVEVGLLSSSRKISNMIFSLNFYQKEAVGDNRRASNYLLYFIDSNGKKISDIVKIIADKTSDDGQERVFRCGFNLKSQNYDNREIYYLIIADETGEQIPQKEEFQIDIASSIDDIDFFS
ncbi:BREX-1 system phosphatase PglZ type A [Lagierella massiliensis]|uniref:BREX-1 system phosphatase PglZ type A n=1 Tax=Lagierella massiliensis TaxID=1689303 RepID=UPI000A888EBB|nr:BREX-1 system phosphatase PglZ type A [Lagierella massiliensis]